MVDFAGDGAFEAAEDVFLREVLRTSALDVGAGAGVVAHTDQSDPVQGGVGLAVPAAGEPVSVGLFGGSREGRGAAEVSELRFCGDPVRVVAGGDQQVSAGHGPGAIYLQHAGVDGGDQLGHLVLELVDFGVKTLIVAGKQAHGVLCCGGWISQHGAGPGRCQSVDQRRCCQGPQRFPACLGSCDQQGLDHCDHPGGGADEIAAGHQQVAQCFHR